MFGASQPASQLCSVCFEGHQWTGLHGWRPLQIVERIMEGQPRDFRIKGSRLAKDSPINNDKEQTMPQANKSLKAPLDLIARALRAVAVRPEPRSFQPITSQIGGAAEVRGGAC